MRLFSASLSSEFVLLVSLECDDDMVYVAFFAFKIEILYQRESLTRTRECEWGVISRKERRGSFPIDIAFWIDGARAYHLPAFGLDSNGSWDEECIIYLLFVGNGRNGGQGQSEAAEDCSFASSAGPSCKTGRVDGTWIRCFEFDVERRESDRKWII